MAYKRKPKRAKESGKLDTTPKSKPEPKESKFKGPIEKAMGMRRTGGGWVLVTYEIQDGQVIKETRTQPDRKNVTVERYKINFVQLFMKE
jgi:hypothetical protein